MDLVLHVASPALPADYLRLPLETLKVGAVGTWHALGLAKDMGARYAGALTTAYRTAHGVDTTWDYTRR